MNIHKDKPIIDLMRSKKFTFSAEFVPPRNGDSLQRVMEKARILKEAGIDFISITKGAGGSLRGGTVPIALLIKERYQLPVIAHFTCMDSTVQEIENGLVDHSYLGITNILALRGDPPTEITAKYCAKDNQHQYAYQLIEQIRNLTEGKYLLRQGYDQNEKDHHTGEKLDFCIGAAVYPEPDDGDVEREYDYFIKKIRAGAEYGITQMTYSPENYGRFLSMLKKNNLNVPVLPGIRVVTTKGQAEFLKKTFNIHVPDDYLKMLKQQNTDQIVLYMTDLVKKFQQNGARGAHFFIMNEEAIVARTINNLSSLF